MQALACIYFENMALSFSHRVKQMETAQKTGFLGTEKIFPLLIKMSLPSAIGMITNALYNIVDTIFVGHGVGPLAIAALAVVFPLQMIVSSFAQALGVGAASIASRRLGEKRPEAAAQAAGTAYSAVMVVTLIFVVIVFLFMKPILVLFGASEIILPYAMEYTSIVAAGFFFFSMSMCASTLVRAEGNAKTSMIGMIIGGVTNMILDPVFIFGFGMGVKGAAIATVISQIVSCAYLLMFYLKGRTSLLLKPANFLINWPCLRESSILGIPAFVQSAGLSILALIINNTLGRYGGDDAITIYGMIFRLNSIIILPVIGVAQGFQPIAGYNYGARSFDRVRVSLRVAIFTAFCVAFCGFLIMMTIPSICLKLFISDNRLITEGSRVLRIMALFIPLAGVQITGSTFFQAIGKPTESFILGLSRQFFILIPLVVLLSRLFGVDGVWMSYPMADFLSTTLTLILLIREIHHTGIYKREKRT